jgi:hypothetical protein
MTTDFRQLQQAARALQLTYQQLLARYHADRGPHAPRSGAVAWAQQEAERAHAHPQLRTSFTNSRLNSPSWAPLAFCLAPEVHSALAARAGLDREEMPSVSPGHYLDAALRTGPARLPEQRACMRNFLTSRGGPLPPGRSTLFRVSPDAHQAVSALRLALAEARLPHEEEPAVISALTSRFLHQLTTTTAPETGHETDGPAHRH